ncbi:hypothetical protein C0993_002127, partial [Termitomyces sp. T159_Od127]
RVSCHAPPSRLAPADEPARARERVRQVPQGTAVAVARRALRVRRGLRAAALHDATARLHRARQRRRRPRALRCRGRRVPRPPRHHPRPRGRARHRRARSRDSDHAPHQGVEEHKGGPPRVGAPCLVGGVDALAVVWDVLAVAVARAARVVQAQRGAGRAPGVRGDARTEGAGTAARACRGAAGGTGAALPCADGVRVGLGRSRQIRARGPARRRR